MHGYNGYVKETPVRQRIINLINAIPQSVRLQVVGDCIPEDGNIHDMERRLTGVCLRRPWAQQAEGTEPSPIVWGGEVYSREQTRETEDMPF